MKTAMLRRKVTENENRTSLRSPVCYAATFLCVCCLLYRPRML